MKNRLYSIIGCILMLVAIVASGISIWKYFIVPILNCYDTIWGKIWSLVRGPLSLVIAAIIFMIGWWCFIPVEWKDSGDNDDYY